MFARCIAISRRAKADCTGITSVEYAVFAAAVVGTMLLSAQNFMTALAGIINSISDSIAAAL
jgi:Flp pilus assembly pilin Flp